MTGPFRSKHTAAVAKSYSAMRPSGLSHCQYLLLLDQSLKSHWLASIFDLTPQHRNICHALKKQMQRKGKLFFFKKSFTYCAIDLGVEIKQMISSQLQPLCVLWGGRTVALFSCCRTIIGYTVYVAGRGSCCSRSLSVHFRIGSSNPAVLGLFMNRKQHC